MNLASLAHSIITGEWRLQREQVREAVAFNRKTRPVRDALIANFDARMQLYAGAEPGTRRQHPNILSAPDDYKQAWERIVLIRAARQMEEDHGFFDGLLGDFEDYVVGEELLYLPGTGNTDADKVIREYLEWQFATCDYSGKHDLTKIAQLEVRSVKRDGECGLIPVDVGDAVKLRYISGDRIGNPMIATQAAPNDYNGIVVHPETEEPIRYDIYRRLPKLNAYTFQESVLPGNFWHCYDPFRFTQFHGVTAFKNAIRDAYDIDEILELSKLNMKWRASQLPTIHNETGRPRGGQFGYFGNIGGPAATTGPGGSPKPLTVNVDGVTTTFMKTDESVVDYPNDFPNAQLSVTVEELRRQSCKGVRIPYEFAYRADQGGVVQRFWVNKAENTFGKEKHRMKIQWLNAYKNRVIQKGIDTGELDLSKFGDLDVSLQRFRGQWQMGKQISVDYGRETDADLKQIDAGLMSERDFCSANSRNLDEVRQEKKDNARANIRDAIEIATEFKLTFDQVAPFLVKKFPNQTPGTAAATDAADDKKTPADAAAT